MITLAILFLTLSFSASFGLIMTNGKISLRSIQLGFYILIIFCCAISLTPNIKLTGNTSLYLITATAFFIALIYSKKIAIDFKGDIPYLVIFLLLIICFFINNLTLLRFHSSPDNHGFAATIGTFISNYSYHDLRHEFMLYTGLNEALHLGQQTPLLNSVWNIADTRLRYTSDMIFTVGRLGIPLWAASIISLFNSVDGFPAFMVANGLFVAFMFAINIRDIITSLTFCKRNPLLWMFFALLLFSPFVTIFILEGTLTQFLLITAASYYISEILVYLNSKYDNYESVFKILVCNIFISLTYPNGIILMGVITALSFPYFLIKDRSLSKISYLSLILLVNLTISYLLLGTALVQLTKSFLSGVSGSPYNLLIISIFDFLSWGTNALKFTEVNGPGTGFINNNKLYLDIKYLILALNSIPLIIFSVISIYMRKRIGYKLIGLIPVFAIFMLPSILPFLDMAHFHSYIYARNLSNYTLIGYPIFCSGIIYFYLSLSKRSKSLLTILVAIITANSIYAFLKSTTKFESSTAPFNIIQNFDQYKELDISNSILVSDTPYHSVSSLALYGPVFYLTDNWNPRFYSNQFPGRINLVYIYMENGKYKMEKIGSIVVDNQIDGPITASQIKKMKSYLPN
jgi:hypothetical protein